MRQMKEKMGDCMNIVVENLVSLPEEDREKVMSQYVSNVDEKDKKNGGGRSTNWRKKRRRKGNGVSRKPNGDTTQTRVRQGGQGMKISHGSKERRRGV